MNNVWIHTNDSPIWDAIIERFQKEGYWEKVIRRTNKPSFSEFKKVITSFELPEQIIKEHEFFYEKLIEKNYDQLDRLYRKTDWGTDRYNSLSFHELSNRIRLYYDFYRLSLLKEKISLVIFYTTPHMGWDNILYEVAKSLNIRTLILDQSKFPNKFFHYFEFNDYGRFKTSKLLGTMEKYEVEKKVEKKWFYMEKNYGREPTFSFRKLFKISKYQLKINNVIERNDYLRLIRELCIKKRRAQAFFRFYTERNYKKAFKATVASTYSLENKFVYFPLHTQPERATSIWGGIYLDQMLAIERLSRLIPRNWFIYVKEAPKQKGAYRGELFFERLKQIPNLVLLPKNANTFDLTKSAQFVATIVGTVGWEAITGGKNVLTFGWGKWYKTLPGVYEYREGIVLDELVNNKIDHELLKKKAAHLHNLCGTGIIYDAYLPSVVNFSMETNTNTVVDSLKKILY